jgi:hypothetical protein
MEPQAEIDFGRNRPEKGRLALHRELVPGMILGETTIGLGMPASTRAGLQVCDQLFQFDAGPARFHPDQDCARRRTDQEIEALRPGVMLNSPWLQADMPRKPAPFENEPRSGRKLAEIFA